MSEKLTIEQNLSLLLETKTKMKENIIASGGTINDDTPFIEYVNYVGASNSGLPIEVASSDEMNGFLLDENVGKIYLYTGETNEVFTNGQLYIIEEVA